MTSLAQCSLLHISIFSEYYSPLRLLLPITVDVIAAVRYCYKYIFQCFCAEPYRFECILKLVPNREELTFIDTMDNDNETNSDSKNKVLPEASFKIQRYFIVVLIILFLMVFFCLFYTFSFNKDVPSMGLTYVGTHFFIPWIIMISLQLLCNIYSIIAWTKNSVR